MRCTSLFRQTKSRISSGPSGARARISVSLFENPFTTSSSTTLDCCNQSRNALLQHEVLHPASSSSSLSARIAEPKLLYTTYIRIYYVCIVKSYFETESIFLLNIAISPPTRKKWTILLISYVLFFFVPEKKIDCSARPSLKRFTLRPARLNSFFGTFTKRSTVYTLCCAADFHW